MLDARAIAAYNAGVQAVAGLAHAAADRLAVQETPARAAKAISALDGIAEGAAALMLRLPESDAIAPTE